MELLYGREKLFIDRKIIKRVSLFSNNHTRYSSLTLMSTAVEYGLVVVNRILVTRNTVLSEIGNRLINTNNKYHAGKALNVYTADRQQ